MKRKSAILFTHVAPAIHGQAMMAKMLMDASANWTEIKLIAINTVYESERTKLQRFSFLKVARFLRYLWQAKKNADQNSVSLVITTMAFVPGSFIKDAVLVFFVKNILHCRVLVWVHMNPNILALNEKPAWFKWLARNMVDNIDGWVACANGLTNTWSAWMRAAPFVAIPNCISDHQGRANPARNSTLTVLYLSALDREKGWRELLAAAMKLCSENLNIRFIFHGGVGFNENLESVKQAFANSGYDDRIVYLGPAYGEQKRQAFTSADLFCLPSYTEAFPLVVLEAMSYGLPCIATDVGAVKEAVVEGETGWLVPAMDENSLLATLSEALTDRDRLRLFGANARNRFAENYTEKIFDANWRRLLEEYCD